THPILETYTIKSQRTIESSKVKIRRSEKYCTVMWLQQKFIYWAA
ncbi:MAG: hypothetical protein ACJAZM_002872, partial [Cyclobacteriaceae bacterium]